MNCLKSKTGGDGGGAIDRQRELCWFIPQKVETAGAGTDGSHFWSSSLQMPQERNG